MKNNILFKILALSVAFCLFLSGCGKKENSSSDKPISSDSEISVSANNSSTVSSDESEIEIFSNDNEDSESLIKNSQSGAEVSFSELEVKKGKANGIDVSKWQGKIDWKKVKSAGIDFAIIRIGYRAENGKIYKDDCADYNIQQADKNGVLIGVYFFSSAISQKEAEEEAKWTANAIKSYPISYPVVWDCEGFGDPNSRMYNLSKADRTDNALGFLNKIKALGYDGMFYSSLSDIKDSVNWDISRIEQSFKIWVAYYPDITYPKVSNPAYSGKYSMWQYTNKGKVSGVSGDTDMVVSYFTAKKAKPKSDIAPPTAKEPIIKDQIYTIVNDKVTAKETVNLRASASTDSKIIATLKNGTVLKRTAKGTNGWSKLIYNGKTVYAITSYLTTDLSYKPPVPETDNDGFKTVNEKVTAKSETNLRDAPKGGNESNVIYTLKNGEIATRIGISKSGWSKLSFNGKILYAVSSYLTTDLSYTPPSEKTESEEETLKTQFTEVNEQVTAKSETNLRTLPSVTDSEVVYTLKNGEYLTRTGISTNGWSRLLYNGKTVYAVSSYLTK